MTWFAWPDVAFAIVAIFGTIVGFNRGFVKELAGLVAMSFAIAAALAYRGAFDRWLHDVTHLGAGVAHIAGMVLYGAMAYASVYAIGAALGVVTRLPILNIVNAVLGALIGACKTILFAWVVVYVALFFPLGGALREDLHRSIAVTQLQRPNPQLDARVRDTLQPFARPYADPLFDHHRV